MNDLHVFYYPVQYGENDYLAISSGSAQAEVGDKVSLRDETTRATVNDLFVTEVTTVPANELPSEILSELGITSVSDFLAGLSNAHKTYFPENVLVTIYRFGEEPIVSYDTWTEAPLVDEIEAEEEIDVPTLSFGFSSPKRKLHNRNKN